MEQATRVLSSDSGQIFLPASVTLAFQRMRQTWRMLVLVGLGMLASVVVVCSVPLYAQVAMTAGLRSALTANSQSTDIVVRGTAYALPSNIIARMTGSLNQEFQHNLGPYLLPEQFSFQTSPFNILVPAAHGSPAISGDEMEMTGTDTALAAAHVHLTQGRMPGSTIHGNTIEVAIRTELAANLGWGPGRVIPVRVVYSTANNSQMLGMIRLQIVGVFTPLKNDDSFWHGENFLGFAAPNGENFIADSLASNTALISLFSQPVAGTQSVITTASVLVWYYSLNTSHIQVSQVDPILNAIQTVQVDNANNTLLNGTTSFQHLQTYLPSSALSLYHDRLPIVQFPVTSLTLLVLCLALFFVTLTTGILVERQAGAIAILRSRGASGRQIFWSLVTQAVLPGLIALVIGPLLAISVVRLLAEHILTVADLGALNIVTGNLLSSALSVGLYALVTAGTMVLTMVLAIWNTASRDVLALRALNRQLGLTILIVTHDVSVAAGVDRTIAIRDGRTSTETVRREAPLEEVHAQVASASAVIGLSSQTHRESILIDRVGRLQLPKEALEMYPFHGRAEVRFADGHVQLWPLNSENSTTNGRAPEVQTPAEQAGETA